MAALSSSPQFESSYLQAAQAAIDDPSCKLPVVAGVAKKDLVAHVRTLLGEVLKSADRTEQRIAIQAHIRKFEELDLECRMQKLSVSGAKTTDEIARTELLRSEGPAEIVGVIGQYLDKGDYILSKKELAQILAASYTREFLKRADAIRDRPLQLQSEASKAIYKVLSAIERGEVPHIPKKIAAVAAEVVFEIDLEKRVSETISEEKLSKMIDFLLLRCPNLRFLDLSSKDNLTKEILEKVAQFPYLQALELSGISKLNDAHVAKLTGMTQLRTCGLSGTGVNDKALELLPRGITRLKLNLCPQLTDKGLKMLGRLEEGGKEVREAWPLVELKVASSQISDSTLASLDRGIQSLDLCNCSQLTDAGLKVLGQQKDAKGQVKQQAWQLEYLRVEGTSITDDTLLSLSHKIEVLDVSNCQHITIEACNQFRAKSDTLVIGP